MSNNDNSASSLSYDSNTKICEKEKRSIEDELINVQTLVTLTRENIDALNNKFSKYREVSINFLTDPQRFEDNRNEKFFFSIAKK